MPPRNERVAAMVLREIAKNPQIGNDLLLEKAVGIDRGVRRLSPRQFHATYRLPALRTVNASAPARPASAPSTRAAKPAAPAAPATPATPATPPASGASPTAPQSAASAPAADAGTPAPAPSSGSAAHPSPAPRAHAVSASTAVGRPHAAEREAVRQILQLVAREALVTEDRAAFVRLLDSLDERAAMILGLFGRS